MNLRITETAFELHLRKIYPTRNILSMRETETVSGQDCLDVQRRLTVLLTSSVRLLQTLLHHG